MVKHETEGVTVICADALEALRAMPDESVHMCVTSPPFYGLRDYGVDGQIGLEATVHEWAERVAGVFAEAKRVIRPDGVLIVEIGDSYDGEKELVDQPGILKNAIRARGWKHRATYIWHKVNCMPESARDRCTVAHSYLLKFVQQRSYFWDSDAIREPAEWARWGDQTVPKHGGTPTAAGWINGHSRDDLQAKASAGRNKRSVWSIPTEPLPFDHYAAFPQALVIPCILAGTSERGVCPVCGAPWTRTALSGATGSWQPSCDCGRTDTIPAVVLDPFLGSGTTALVARKLGRRAIGIELSPEYVEIALRRLKDPAALNRAALATDGPAQLAMEEVA